MLWMFGIIVFLTATALVPLAIHILTKKGILDIPNSRVQMSHTHELPTPRGGGLAIMPVIFIAWCICLVLGWYQWPAYHSFLTVVLCGIGLCGLVWFDDRTPGGLRVRTRLLGQLLAVSIPLIFWPQEFGRLLPEFVPLGLERILMALAWVWFLNLFNFMDGINGVSGAETISISLGLLFFSFIKPVPEGFEFLLVTMIASAAGFLVWNGRRVAKIFLGDIGSIGLGYCLAYLLFVYAAQGSMMPAVVITLVYCMDTTITLLTRAYQKKKIWQAHREHFYHRATVKGGLSHAACVGWILLTNVILTFIGYVLLQGYIGPLMGFILGVLVTGSLLFYFNRIGKMNGHKSSPRPKRSKRVSARPN